MAVVVAPRFLAAFLQELLGFSASVNVTCYASGALDIDVRRGDLVTIVQGLSSWDEFGLTPDLGPGAGFNDGHPFVFATHQEVFSALINTIRPEGLTDHGIGALASRVIETMELHRCATGRLDPDARGDSRTPP